MNVNGNTMLGKINLGGNKTLPDVYDVFTSYYNFDFDFDGAIDSLDCVTIGQVAAAKDAQKRITMLRKLLQTSAQRSQTLQMIMTQPVF